MKDTDDSNKPKEAASVAGKSDAIEEPIAKEIRIPKPIIPGLPEAERVKKPKRSRKKVKGKVESQPLKKSSKLVQKDFLKVVPSIVEPSSADFVYSDEEEFEDSIDVFSEAEESIDNFLTPLSFKSAFDLKLSASTPDLSFKIKRPAPSPVDKLESKRSKSIACQNDQ